MSPTFCGRGSMRTIDVTIKSVYNTGTKECCMQRCTKCHETKSFEFFSKDKYRNNGYRIACKACAAASFTKYRASDAYALRQEKATQQRTHQKQTDPVARWATMAIGNARKRAKQLGVPCTITKEWLVAAAPTHCPLLEVSLDYAATVSCAASASVDRKDSTGGYTPENCKIISFKANRIKSNATADEISLVAQNMRNY